MATTVTVEAHVGPGIEVQVLRGRLGQPKPDEKIILKDGEAWVGHVYDNTVIGVRERPTDVGG